MARSTHAHVREWGSKARKHEANRLRQSDREAAIREAREDLADEHADLCHSDGSPCLDGCDAAPVTEALIEYKLAEADHGYAQADADWADRWRN